MLQEKKIKQLILNFSREALGLISYDDEILNGSCVDLRGSSKSYKEMLLGDGDSKDDLKEESEGFTKINDDTNAKDDYNGFWIIEELDRERPCLVFWYLLKKKEECENRGKKTLIIKLLRQKIRYKALESKLFQLWARDGVIEIIDLANKYYLIKYALIRGS